MVVSLDVAMVIVDPAFKVEALVIPAGANQALYPGEGDVIGTSSLPFTSLLVPNTILLYGRKSKKIK